jgi:hypothetical protein
MGPRVLYVDFSDAHKHGAETMRFYSTRDAGTQNVAPLVAKITHKNAHVHREQILNHRQTNYAIIWKVKALSTPLRLTRVYPKVSGLSR